ncbi:MAG: hypothetical protein ACR2NN_03815 [Bryobacteraceae bacterium]
MLLFGFLRGVVLGLAGMTIAGPTFGVWFGLLSGAGLSGFYAIGFAPTDDYETEAKPHISRHKLLASFSRALAVSAAGVIAGLLISSSSHWLFLRLKLGLAAGAVSALLGLFSPAFEWWIENLPERRLGVAGSGFDLYGYAVAIRAVLDRCVRCASALIVPFRNPAPLVELSNECAVERR